MLRSRSLKIVAVPNAKRGSTRIQPGPPPLMVTPSALTLPRRALNGNTLVCELVNLSLSYV